MKPGVITAVLRRDGAGRDVLLIGIDREMVRQLVGGQPLFINAAEIEDSVLDVALLYGDTLQEIIAELREGGFALPDHIEMGKTYVKGKPT